MQLKQKQQKYFFSGKLFQCRENALNSIKKDVKCQNDSTITFRRVLYHKFSGVSYTQEIYEVKNYQTISGKTSHFICLEDHFLGHIFEFDQQFFPHFHAVQTEEVQFDQIDSKDTIFFPNEIIKDEQQIIGVNIKSNNYVPYCLNHYFYYIKQDLGQEQICNDQSALSDMKTIDKKVLKQYLDKNKEIINNEKLFLKKFCKWIYQDFDISSELDIQIE